MMPTLRYLVFTTPLLLRAPKILPHRTPATLREPDIFLQPSFEKTALLGPYEVTHIIVCTPPSLSTSATTSARGPSPDEEDATLT